MQDDDKFELPTRPWEKRIRAVPLRTFSGRVVYERPKHFFTAKDAARIIRKLEPPEDTSSPNWAFNLISVLRLATIAMLERILWFLPLGIIDEFYQFGIQLLDKMFRIQPDVTVTRPYAINVINSMASMSQIEVKITVPKKEGL